MFNSDFDNVKFIKFNDESVATIGTDENNQVIVNKYSEFYLINDEQAIKYDTDKMSMLEYITASSISREILYNFKTIDMIL